MSLAGDATMLRATNRADGRSRADTPPWSGDADRSPRARADAANQPTHQPATSFGDAIAALRRGVQETEELHARCARLRAELSDAEARQRERLLALQGEMLHWQDVVCEIANQVQANHSQMRDLLVKNDRVRETAEREQRRAEVAERRSQSFERLVLGIHDQILSAIVKDRCMASEVSTTDASGCTAANSIS